MWIAQRYRQLADVDVGALAARLLELPESLWHADEAMQRKMAGDRATQSIYLHSLVGVDFDVLIQNGPISADDVPRAAGWESLHDLVDPLVAAAVAHYPAGGVVTRVQLARMPPGCEISPHTDMSLILTATHRLHIPVITSPDVDFMVAGEKIEMAAGKLYELNNRVEHSVLNRGQSARTHLIIDYLPPENNRPAIVSRNFERRNQQLAADVGARPAPRREVVLPKVIATSVVRGSHQNESHGGIYLVDMASGSFEQVVDWNNCDIDWAGRGWDRGLRGIAIHGEHIYVAASDELYCFDRRFDVVASFRNPFLKHAHEIVRYQDHLLVTSTGFDSVLRFDLRTRRFDRGWFLQVQNGQPVVRLFDPQQAGPQPGNTLHLNHVHQDDAGIYVSGRRMPTLLRLHQGNVHRHAQIPLGTHNARPYGVGGVIYQDTNSDMVVYQNGADFASVDVPRYPEHALEHRDLGDDRVARQAFGRGLCLFRDDIVLAGSSPSTITAIDLRAKAAIKSVNLTMDVRNAIHGLELWPFD